MCGGVDDAAEQQLLSITSAPSGVISKQTDWNRPTEASPRERARDGQRKSGTKGGRGAGGLEGGGGWQTNPGNEMRRTQLKRWRQRAGRSSSYNLLLSPLMMEVVRSRPGQVGR